MRRIVLSLVGLVGAGSLLGCGGPKLEALPGADQIGIHKNRGILEKRDDLALLVRTAPIPWEDDGQTLAFLVEVSNYREQPVEISYQDFVLVTEDDLQRSPMDPGKLQDAFANAVTQADEGVPPELRHAVASRSRRRHYYRHPHHHRDYGYYDPGYRDYRWRSYYGWGPYGYDHRWDEYDEQAARERISQFLAKLLNEKTVNAKEVASGFVLFTYEPHDEEVITLRVGIRPVGNDTESDKDGRTTFEFQFERK